MTQESQAGEPAPSVLRNKPLLLIASAHWLSMTGLALVLTAIVSWLVFLAAEMRSETDNPYSGIALLVVIPLGLLFGMVLTVVGIYLGRRRARRRFLRGVSDRKVAVRRLIGLVGALVVINLTIGSQATLQAVHHMESRNFCSSCHVMTPQTRAAEFAPHASLGCVDCHVGSGASGWIDSKISGTRQLLEVMFDRVPKPVPSAIASGRMISSDQTCEQCHWPDKPTSLTMQIFKRYDEDEENTEATTVLTMHVGGRTMGGIHGSHNGPGVEIRFAARDPERQEIPWVQYTNSETGEERTYFADGVEPADVEDLPVATMQCIDCHNRVAHTFQAADDAVDIAMALGRISVGLPYVKMKSREILEVEYASSEEAAQKIPAALVEYYRAEYPAVHAEREDAIEGAAATLADIYSRNVFPEHGITWGTYPDNIGHERFPGCFRCHGGEHETADGVTLSQNCVDCHSATAVEESDPEILKELGWRRPIKRMEQK
jgi:nitrate/TMAO reductase-like tetraheme cytochrome c subunit